MPGVADVADRARGGRIVYIQSTKFRHRPRSYYQDGWHGTWAFDGGVLAQQAIHCIDLVCWIAQRAPARVAALGFRAAHEIECEDTGSVLMDFGDFAATVTGTTAAGRDGPANLTVITRSGVYRNEQVGWDDGAPPMWRAVAEALESGGESPVSVASALPGLHVLHAAYLSIDRSGAWIDLGDMHPRLGGVGALWSR